MTVFPGWRAVGEVMRWARTCGATVTRTRYGRPHVLPDGSKSIYVCHQWEFGDTSVTVGSYVGRTDPDLTIIHGRAREDLAPKTAKEALDVLGALGVIPAELLGVAS
jgi:hypothetical protein